MKVQFARAGEGGALHLRVVAETDADRLALAEFHRAVPPGGPVVVYRDRIIAGPSTAATLGPDGLVFVPQSA